MIAGFHDAMLASGIAAAIASLVAFLMLGTVKMRAA